MGYNWGMSEFKGIPILQPQRPARSGDKYTTAQGFTAIKDGVKRSAAPGRRPPCANPPGCGPPWPPDREFAAVKQIVREHRLSTVCEEAKCPNIGECWNAGTATIMLMGAVCTRACRFCAVDTGNPRGWLDARRAAERGTLGRVDGPQVRGAHLRRIAMIFPTADPAHYAAAIRAIKRRNPGTAVEALTPDFQGVHARRANRRRLGFGRVRAERRDRATPDPSGARSARRL